MTNVEVLGDYLLIEKIGTGGMARTYKALSPKDSTHVCIKILHPHLADDEHNVRMFVDEATICRDLQHPNIVRLLEYGQIDGKWYISFELVVGEDLKTVLDHARASGVAMSPVLCAEIVIELLRALDYIHNKRSPEGEPLNIVHRDVTPHNLMLDYEGKVKLADFGVAKAAFRLSRTSTGAIKGKYGYMSPEQVRSVDVDGRSDVFAAGILLHEMLAGRHLFQGESPYITIANLISKEIEPPSRWNPAVDADLDAIVLEALARDPDERFVSAAEMLHAMQSWIARQAMNGDVADLGKFVRDLYGLELDRPSSRPRRITSDELEAMVHGASGNVYPSGDGHERPSLSIVHNTGELRLADASEPGRSSVDRVAEGPPDIDEDLASLIDEVLSHHDPYLSMEIPIDIEHLDPESTPSGEIDINALRRVRSDRVPALPLGKGDTEHTATEASPLQLPTQEVEAASHDATSVDATVEGEPPASVDGRVPALPPGAELPPFVAEEPTRPDHPPRRHRAADNDDTREIAIDASKFDGRRGHAEGDADRTREVVLSDLPDDALPDATIRHEESSTRPPGHAHSGSEEVETFQTTEIAAENLRDTLERDRVERGHPRVQHRSTVVIEPDELAARLAQHDEDED